MRTTKKLSIAACSVALTMTAAACGSSEGGGTGDGAEQAEEKAFTIIVPSDPGGGWDQTARAVQKALDDCQLTSKVEVTNVPGGSGSVGLTQVAGQEGQDDVMLMAGLALVSSVVTTGSEVKVDAVEPVSRLMGEYEAIVVPADSEYQTLEDLIDDIKADPQSVPIAAGAAGSADHLFLGLLAEEVGVDPTELNYVAFSGGGEALTAILGGQVAAGVSGTGEFAEQVKAGELRALAVSSEERVSSLPDAPSITEAGYETVFSNWRGVFVPAGLSDEQMQTYQDLMAEMHDCEVWQTTLETQAWDDQFMAGEEFGTWLSEEQDRVAKVLDQLGLAA